MPNRGKNDNGRKSTGAYNGPPSFSDTGTRGQAGNRQGGGYQRVPPGKAPSDRYCEPARDGQRRPPQYPAQSRQQIPRDSAPRYVARYPEQPPRAGAPQRSPMADRPRDNANYGAEPRRQNKRSPSRRSIPTGGSGNRPREDGRTPQGRYGETASASVRRKAQSKSRAAKIYLFVAISAVAAAVVLALTVFFNINEIEVRGNARYSSESIIEYSGISIGDNLLLMDKFKSIDRIKKNLIYIGDVEIRRFFPSKLVITVREISVAAAFGADGAYWLCDDGGMLLELSQTPPEGAAVVTGAKLEKPKAGTVFRTADKTKQQPLEELFEALKKNSLFGSVRSIDIAKIYEIKINYLDRYDIIFGKSGELDVRCGKLCALIPQLEAQGNTGGTIDMSGDEIHFIADKP